MQTIDTIVLGDSQFFGINNMSEDKAQQLAEKFDNLGNILKVYDYAYESGIRGFMLNTNEKAKEICTYFRENKGRYPHMNWYASIPYTHKYSLMMADKGPIPTIKEIIFSNNSAKGLVSLFAKGGSAIIEQDAVRVMQMLIDIEMKVFQGLKVKAIFLQDTITDLLLGLKTKIFFQEFVEYIKKRYKVLPGFLTMNLPVLLRSLQHWSIEEVVICSSINKMGFLMSPDKKSYEDTLKIIDKNKYYVMAMSVFASGAIMPDEAIEYVTSQNVDSVVFGVSSFKNIKETKELLDKKFTYTGQFA